MPFIFPLKVEESKIYQVKHSTDDFLFQVLIDNNKQQQESSQKYYHRNKRNQNHINTIFKYRIIILHSIYNSQWEIANGDNEIEMNKLWEYVINIKIPLHSSINNIPTTTSISNIDSNIIDPRSPPSSSSRDRRLIWYLIHFSQLVEPISSDHQQEEEEDKQMLITRQWVNDFSSGLSHSNNNNNNEKKDDDEKRKENNNNKTTTTILESDIKKNNTTTTTPPAIKRIHSFDDLSIPTKSTRNETEHEPLRLVMPDSLQHIQSSSEQFYSKPNTPSPRLSTEQYARHISRSRSEFFRAGWPRFFHRITEAFLRSFAANGIGHGRALLIAISALLTFVHFNFLFFIFILFTFNISGILLIEAFEKEPGLFNSFVENYAKIRRNNRRLKKHITNNKKTSSRHSSNISTTSSSHNNNENNRIQRRMSLPLSLKPSLMTPSALSAAATAAVLNSPKDIMSILYHGTPLVPSYLGHFQ